MKNLLLLFLTSIIATVSAQEIDKKHLVNNWKFVKMGDVEMPAELSMIAKLSDSTITIGSQISVSSWNYTLGENNTLILKLDAGQEERWEIKKLTETEFVFRKVETGEFYLVKTEEDLPAIVAPIEEAQEEEETKIYSIETDYKASKKTVKLLQGTWDVETVGGVPSSEGVNLSVEFKKDSKTVLFFSGTPVEKGSWNLTKDGKKIELKDRDGGIEELWGIKSLDKNNLIVVDANSGDIVLKKAKKAKK
jgi:hypothetical protein